MLNFSWQLSGNHFNSFWHNMIVSEFKTMLRLTFTEVWILQRGFFSFFFIFLFRVDQQCTTCLYFLNHAARVCILRCFSRGKYTVGMWSGVQLYCHIQIYLLSVKHWSCALMAVNRVLIFLSTWMERREVDIVYEHLWGGKINLKTPLKEKFIYVINS